MTETMIDLPNVIAKSDDADFLRELIQDAAQRLMDIEVAGHTGGSHATLASRKTPSQTSSNGTDIMPCDTILPRIGI